MSDLVARRLVGGLLVLLVSLAGLGCDNPTCQRMTDCCEAIEGVEGVGRACGDIARQLDDAESCRSVLEAVRAMYESRDDSVPEACLSDESEGGPSG
jgi:hypothetical protein